MIKYEPSKILKRIMPVKRVEKMLTSKFSLKRSALTFVEQFDFLDKQALTRVALKAIKGYKARIDDDPDIEGELLADPKQLIARVQNEVVTQIAGEIKDQYSGETYTWLPTDADEPDPEHQLNYGLEFTVGEGEMPGDRFGCRCGMDIHVAESTLYL